MGPESSPLAGKGVRPLATNGGLCTVFAAGQCDRWVAPIGNPCDRWVAPIGNWGSTGIRLIDMTGNGEQDLLISHGDAVQVPPVIRPYHGFGWLENDGQTPMSYHRLAHLPGAHTAQAADLDGDGNLEIVSSGFIPAYDPARSPEGELETVIWLKQTQSGQYQRYVLETGYARYACMDLGDWDDDGDVDIVLGNFVLYDDPDQASAPAILVLENTSR